MAILASGVVSLLLCVGVRNEALCLIAFCLFNVAYECIWLFNSSEFFKHSPAHSLARYQFTLTASASGLMAVSTVGYSLMIENYGEKGFVAVMTIVIIFWRLLSSSRKCAFQRVAIERVQ